MGASDMARKGHPISAATRAKISAALKGRHRASAKPKKPATARGASRVGKPHPHAGHGRGTKTRKPPKTARRKGVRHLRVPKTARRKGVRHIKAPKTTRRKGVHTTAVKHGSAHATLHHARTGKHGTAALARTAATHRPKRQSHRGALISATPKRHLAGRLKTMTRHHHYRPVIRRKPRAHRVWRRRKK